MSRPLGSAAPEAGPCDPSSQVTCLTVTGWEDKTQCSCPLKGSRLFIPLTKKTRHKGRKGTGAAPSLCTNLTNGAHKAVKSPPDPRLPQPRRLHPPASLQHVSRLRGPKHRTERARPAQRALPGPPHAPAPRVSSSARPSCPRTPAARNGPGEVRPTTCSGPYRGHRIPAANILAT